MAWFPARYAALPRSSFDIEDEVQDIKPREPQRIPLLQWKTHLLVFSLIANILFASSFVHALAFGGKHIKSHTGLSEQPHIKIPFQWWSAYSSPNSTDDEAVDSAWDNIARDFGLVAVDHTWAEKQGAPPAMDLPSNPSKGIYVVEAYHSLHCLMMIRKSYTQSIRNLPLTIPMHHISHYFDSLRQHIQCTAPDNLLYTHGKHSSGDGQVRQCRDWSYLHAWTVAHSTCNPITHDPEPILSQYNLCSDDLDGLPAGINRQLR